MARKSNAFAVVQFDERVISMLRFRRSAKGVAVVACDTERGQWSLEDGSLQAALAAFAKRCDLASCEVYSILPRHEMTARILSLPTQSADEAAAMVRLSAEEYVPYPVHELVIDQCLLHKHSTGEARFMAVFAHRDLVDAHVKALHSAGIDPERIFVSSACLATAVRAVEVAAERYAVVHLGSGGLEVQAFHQQRLEYARGIATTQDWSVAGDPSSEAFQELAMEVRASLSAYRRESEDGLGADTIYLSSEWMDVAPVCEALAQDLGVECLPATFARALITEKKEAVDHLPVVLLGGALAAQDRASVAINLVPASLVRMRKAAVAKRRFLQTALAAAVVLVALGALYAQAVMQRTAYIRELEEKVAAVRPAAEGVSSKVRQLRTIQRQVSRRGGALELWARVSEVAPNDLTIETFTYVRGERVVITGRAKDRSIVEDFANSLRALSDEGIPEFAAAVTPENKSITERNQNVMYYEIAIPFPETDEDEAEAAEL